MIELFKIYKGVLKYNLYIHTYHKPGGRGYWLHREKQQPHEGTLIWIRDRYRVPNSFHLIYKILLWKEYPEMKYSLAANGKYTLSIKFWGKRTTPFDYYLPAED